MEKRKIPHFKRDEEPLWLVVILAVGLALVATVSDVLGSGLSQPRVRTVGQRGCAHQS